MRQFAMTVTVLSMFAAMAAAAQADVLHGAPVKQGNKCFKFSPGSDSKEYRFGYWADCPQTASAAATPQVSRRHRAATR